MGRTSQAKDQLIASGCALMHERGYTAVGVGEICAAAGVNKGSFYYFFPSKRDLAVAVVDRFWSETQPAREELLQGEGRPVERIERFFAGAYRQHCECHAENGKLSGCPLGNLALEMSTQDSVLQQRLHEIFESYVDHFDRVLTEAVADGDLPGQDTRRTARSIVSMMEGAVMLAKMSNDPQSLDGLGSEVLRLARAGPT